MFFQTSHFNFSNRDYNQVEHETWKLLFQKQKNSIKNKIHPLFEEGLKKLNYSEEKIPKLSDVNRCLKLHSNFESIWVSGLEGPIEFFSLLKNRKFPVGHFIRDQTDLGYTPAPDIFHDSFGHLPFLTNLMFANFSQRFGECAFRYKDVPHILRQFERLYWFTLEFGLLKTEAGPKVFGAGLVSSFSETEFALSDQPEIITFDLEKIRHLEFKIDEFQKKLFLIPNLETLYSCLETFEKGIQC